MNSHPALGGCACLSALGGGRISQLSKLVFSIKYLVCSIPTLCFLNYFVNTFQI